MKNIMGVFHHRSGKCIQSVTAEKFTHTHKLNEWMSDWMTDCPRALECANSLFRRFGGVAKTLRLTIDETERIQNICRISYMCASGGVARKRVFYLLRQYIHSLLLYLLCLRCKNISKCAIRAAQILKGSTHKWRRLAFAQIFPMHDESTRISSKK